MAALRQAIVASLIAHSYLMTDAFNLPRLPRPRRSPPKDESNANTTDPCHLNKIPHTDEVASSWVPFLYRVSCAKGYHLTGRDMNDRTVNVFCFAGQSVPKRLSCEACTCSVPKTELYNSEFLLPDKYYVNETMEMVCLDGYTLAKNNSNQQTLKCLADGTWSPRPQRCTEPEAMCNLTLEHAKVDPPSARRATLMTVTCHPGYHVEGHELNVKTIHVLCDIYGKNDLSKTPRCVETKCKVHQIANATILPDPPLPGIVKISCHKGFHIADKPSTETSATVLCTTQGDIVPALPSCRVTTSQCVIPNSKYLKGQFRSAGANVAYPGTNVTFSCNNGYKLSLSGDQRASEQSLFCTNNGTWLPEPQACSLAAPAPSGPEKVWIKNKYSLISLGTVGLLFIVTLIGGAVAVSKRRKKYLDAIDCEHTSLLSADSMDRREPNGLLRKKPGGEDETQQCTSVKGADINNEARSEHQPRLPRNKRKQAKVPTSSNVYASLSWSANGNRSARSDCAGLNSRERSPQSTEEHDMSNLHYVNIDHAFSQQAQKAQPTGRKK